MPWPSGRESRYIRPRDCCSGVSANSTAKACTQLLLAIARVCSMAAESQQVAETSNGRKYRRAKTRTRRRMNPPWGKSQQMIADPRTGIELRLLLMTMAQAVATPNKILQGG